MPYYDFIINEDIEAIDGDMIQEIGEKQNARDIIYANKGNYFMSPTTGVGIYGQLNSEYELVTKERDIRSELKRDGFTITKFEHLKDADGSYYSDIRAKK